MSKDQGLLLCYLVTKFNFGGNNDKVPLSAW